MGFGGTGDGALGCPAVMARLARWPCPRRPAADRLQFDGPDRGSGNGWRGRRLHRQSRDRFRGRRGDRCRGKLCRALLGRTRQGAEQDAIADVAGELPVGTEAAWKIEHTIPIGDEHGQLRVIRAIDSPLTACKEIAFSVDAGKGQS